MAYYSQDGDTLSPPGRAARLLNDHEESCLVCDGSGHSVLEQRPLMPAVHAWLENHHVNDWTRDGETLLWYVAARVGDMYDDTSRKPSPRKTSSRWPTTCSPAGRTQTQLRDMF